MSTSKSPAPLTSQVLLPSRRGSTTVYVIAALVSLGTAAGVCAGALLWQPASAPEHGPRSVVIVLPPAAACHPSASNQACAPAEVDTATPEEPTQPEPAITPVHSDYALVFELDGHSYVAISTIDKPDVEGDEPLPPGTFPPHGPLRLVGDKSVPDGAIAALADNDLPADVAAWRGHRVVVDNRCQARVTDLALVGLISGSLDDFYWADGEPGEVEVAEAVLHYGNTVIAGRLAGCKVPGGIARSAHLPLAMPAIEIEDDEAAAVARAQLVASRLSREAQRAYAETGQEGTWWQAEERGITTKVIRHARTGEVLVSVHAAVDQGCGGANINIWGLYRVERSGAANVAVTALRLTDSAAIAAIERAVDLDGDGSFEFSGRTVDGDPVVVSAEGKTIRLLEIPFYGCPC